MDNNEPITEHGLFWLLDNEQRKLWGTLYINDVNGSTLETFGSLIDPIQGDSHTIIGQIRSGQKWVTLIDCFPTNTRNWGWSGEGQLDWSRQTCVVNGVVEGVGFEKGEEIAFEQATLRHILANEVGKPQYRQVRLHQGNSQTQSTEHLNRGEG